MIFIAIYLPIYVVYVFITYVSFDNSQVYFEADEVEACIVTCGGLCPGLNTVVRELVCGLYHMYGVTRVLGIEVSSHLFGQKILSCDRAL